MTRIGAFEAKTHLPKLLTRVEAGETIAITRHGEEVAHLVPPPRAGGKIDLADAVERWKKTRNGVKLRGLKVRDLIRQGRR
ncbi:MAG TPA: type II toxin-antitoxin system prevent-host-death family antitoxin [Tepidisphaeraceae bacterium]|nr:type II toxin-antitoxin system prevent-host-death family antitoxin [Tepidisphaeraceae bacterium]